MEGPKIGWCCFYYFLRNSWYDLWINWIWLLLDFEFCLLSEHGSIRSLGRKTGLFSVWARKDMYIRTKCTEKSGEKCHQEMFIFTKTRTSGRESGWQREMMMIIFITFNSTLVPLLEGLYSSNPWDFEFQGFGRNRTDDLEINSPSLWPTEPRLHWGLY